MKITTILLVNRLKLFAEKRFEQTMEIRKHKIIYSTCSHHQQLQKGDHVGPQIPNTFPKLYRTKAIRTPGNFYDTFCYRKMLKDIIKVCSHIQKNAQNPNTIFKISIYCEKYNNNNTILSNIDVFEKT